MFNNESLSLYKKNHVVLQKLIEQLNKDFRENNLLSNFVAEEGMLYESLYRQVYTLIQQLAENNFGSLLQLLYRIDVSENKIKEANSKEIDSIAAISHLLLERELVKVVMKMKYSENNEI